MSTTEPVASARSGQVVFTVADRGNRASLGASPSALQKTLDRLVRAIRASVRSMVNLELWRRTGQGEPADVEDVTQEVLIDVAGRAKRARGIRKLIPLVKVIVTRRLIDRHRAQSAGKRGQGWRAESLDAPLAGTDGDDERTLGETIPSNEPDPAEVATQAAERAAQRELLLRAWRVLEVGEAKVLLLHYVEDLTMQETARAMGWKSKGNVSKWCTRALEKLREEVERLAEESDPPTDVP
jgi:RNA polymerase sigma-70 factor (ECF subfamily)